MKLILNKRVMTEYASKFASILNAYSLDQEEREHKMLAYYDSMKGCFDKYKVGIKGKLAVCHSLDTALTDFADSIATLEELKQQYSAEEFNPFYDFKLLFQIIESDSLLSPGLLSENADSFHTNCSVEIEVDTEEPIMTYSITKEDETVFKELFIDAVRINNFTEDQIGEVMNRYLSTYALPLVKSGCLPQRVYEYLIVIFTHLSKLDYDPYGLQCNPVITYAAYEDCFKSSHVLYFKHVLSIIRMVYLDSLKPKEPYPDGTPVVFHDNATGKIVGLIPAKWIGNKVYGYVVLLDVKIKDYSIRFCTAKDFNLWNF